MALAAVPVGLFLTWCAASIWNATGPQPPDAPGPYLVLGDWLASTLPLLRDGEPVWGWREFFWVAPAMSLPAAFALARAPWPTKAGRVAARTMSWALLAATTLVASAYVVGVGFPADLLAILVATVAATVAGASALRHRAPLPRGQALAMTLALPLFPPLALVGMGYPSPAAFLGLLVALAWGAVVVARNDPPSRDA